MYVVYLMKGDEVLFSREFTDKDSYNYWKMRMRVIYGTHCWISTQTITGL